MKTIVLSSNLDSTTPSRWVIQLYKFGIHIYEQVYVEDYNAGIHINSGNQTEYCWIGKLGYHFQIDIKMCSFGYDYCCIGGIHCRDLSLGVVRISWGLK